MFPLSYSNLVFSALHPDFIHRQNGSEMSLQTHHTLYTTCFNFSPLYRTFYDKTTRHKNNFFPQSITLLNRYASFFVQPLPKSHFHSPAVNLGFSGKHFGCSFLVIINIGNKRAPVLREIENYIVSKRQV